MQSLLTDAGITEEQLEELLNSVEASRTPDGDHFSFEEAREYGSLPIHRQQHLDSCEYCAELIQCILSAEEVTHLAQQAARHAGNRPAPRLRFATCAGILLVIGVSLFSAFIVGRASSTVGVAHADMARYIDELGTLKAQGDDAGSRFRAARLYAKLDLKREADKEFLAALQVQNVKQNEIARFQELSAKANDIGVLERAFAQVRMGATSPNCEAAASADACLSYAQLQLKAGRWMEAYKSFLHYLTLINERPAGAEQYDETLKVAAGTAASAHS